MFFQYVITPIIRTYTLENVDFQDLSQLQFPEKSESRTRLHDFGACPYI